MSKGRTWIRKELFFVHLPFRSAGGPGKVWVDLRNPNSASCSENPSTCSQSLMDKTDTTIVPVAHMDVMDFSDVAGSSNCVKFKENIKVETKGCSMKATVLCESSCTQTRK